MALEETADVSAADEPIRRRGDRRQTTLTVVNDRRKSDRRATPGMGELIRALFRRPGPRA